jgi:single-strand DNA-binding protein
MNLNKAMVIGNLTRDPEIRTTPSGVNVASFSVATNMIWTDQAGQRQEKAEFHNIVAWRRLAEICGQYLKKGSKIYIEGRLQTREWVGQDSIKRYRTEIIAENMIMLDNKMGGGFSPAPARNENPAYHNEPAIGNSQMDDPMPIDEDIKVEDIPF